MTGLNAAPELRGVILTKTVGFHERIARKKTAESAAEDLRIALEEAVATPSDILQLLSADDRVLYLSQSRLFAFAIEEGFFSGEGASKPSARDGMLFLLETALGEGVLKLADITDGVSFRTLSESLPVGELQKVVEAALRHGRRNEPLTEQRLLEVVPLATLVRHLSLELLWNRVILAKVALPANFVEGARPARGEATIEPIAVRPSLNEPAPQSASLNGKVQIAAPEVPAPTSNPRVDSLLDIEVPADEDVARRRVIERLLAISRLPPRHAELSTQILFSIDSMYADLANAASEEDREDAIRDAFPNEQHLSSALLALIELLEPTVDIKDPDIAKADVDSLINVFLIEEKEHQDKPGATQRPSGPAPALAPAGPPGPPPRRSAPPPPLPRPGSALAPALPLVEKTR